MSLRSRTLLTLPIAVLVLLSCGSSAGGEYGGPAGTFLFGVDLSYLNEVED